MVEDKLWYGVMIRYKEYFTTSSLCYTRTWTEMKNIELWYALSFRSFSLMPCSYVDFLKIWLSGICILPQRIVNMTQRDMYVHDRNNDGFVSFSECVFSFELIHGREQAQEMLHFIHPCWSSWLGDRSFAKGERRYRAFGDLSWFSMVKMDLGDEYIFSVLNPFGFFPLVLQQQLCEWHLYMEKNRLCWLRLGSFTNLQAVPYARRCIHNYKRRAMFLHRWGATAQILGSKERQTLWRADGIDMLLLMILRDT